MSEILIIDHKKERKQGGGRPPKSFTREDLEAMEREYRLGNSSLKNIAVKYGISDDTLKRMADQLGWVRNMRGRVAKHVYDKLHGAEPLIRPTFSREEATVEQAAISAVTMIREHMETTHHVFKLTGVAAQQLEDAMASRNALEVLIVQETIEADVGEGREQNMALKKREAMLKAVALPTHVATLKDLAIAMKSVVELSRVLMGIHESPPPAPESSDMPSVADERIEELRERLRLSVTKSAPAG